MLISMKLACKYFNMITIIISYQGFKKKVHLIAEIRVKSGGAGLFLIYNIYRARWKIYYFWSQYCKFFNHGLYVLDN